MTFIAPMFATGEIPWHNKLAEFQFTHQNKQYIFQVGYAGYQNDFYLRLFCNGKFKGGREYRNLATEPFTDNPVGSDIYRLIDGYMIRIQQLRAYE